MSMRTRFVFLLSFFCCLLYAQQPLYKQAHVPIEKRVDDLISRMTLTEKIGQLSSPYGWEMFLRKGNRVELSELFIQSMKEMPKGCFWGAMRADPWTQKTFENGLTAGLSVEALNAMQRYAIEETRLGIPILFAEETPHGHMAIGATVFPTALLEASTFDTDLMRRVGEAQALEIRSRGGNIGYGPVLDIAREPRWSRVEETFGEDPYLTAQMGVEVMKGMQGERQDDGRHVFATLKHFAAYGIPEGGHNGEKANIGRRQLFSELMPAFKKAVQGGAGTVMTSYNTIDGVPSTCNSFLLTDILRKQWGFNGFVFSDLTSIEGIVGARVAKDRPEAASLAIKAGVDLDLCGNAYRTLPQALERGLVTMADIDKAVRNVLRLKFRLGLFEHPYATREMAEKVVRSTEHKALAREVAQKGITLLKNDGILPLSKQVRSIAVIGPNADMMYNQLGDYTAPQRPDDIVTPLGGIRAAVSSNTKVLYAKGCAVRDTTQSNIDEAVRIAKETDVTILVVGGSSARDFKTEYIETGAAKVSEDVQLVSDMDCGEGFDRSSLRLLGHQERLIEALSHTGKPLVIVYIEGRPMNMNLASERANALLNAWYPGEQGGTALADVLFGNVNPAGRLPVSIPRNEGQLPVYYSQGNYRAYMDGESGPLYAFGYGLSYTTFDYSDMKIEPGNGKDVLQKVSCTVENTGKRAGDEVVQLYIRDCVASVSQPPILLRGFQRIHLEAGERTTVTFNLGEEELGLYNLNYEYVVEPGEFKVMIGAASNDIRLDGSFVLP